MVQTLARAVLPVLAVGLLPLLLQGCGDTAGEESPPSSPSGKKHMPMKCGAEVELCGVLTLESGLGRARYQHPEPVVHGLWPQNGEFGTSRCMRPGFGGTTPPTNLWSCYQQTGGKREELLHFQAHEWQKHGRCAGVNDARDYFEQVCGLADGPLQVMRATRHASGGLGAMAAALQAAGYHVWGAGDSRGSEVELAVCAGNDRRWKFSAPKDFALNCGSGAASGAQSHASGHNGSEPAVVPLQQVGGSSQAEAAATVSCHPGRRGPKCSHDGDCSGARGCLRCARSGFCTQEPVAFLGFSKGKGINRGHLPLQPMGL